MLHSYQYTETEGGFWRDWESHIPPEMLESWLRGKEIGTKHINLIYRHNTISTSKGALIEMPWLDTSWWSLPHMIQAHSLRFPDGREWDAINGWRD